MGRDLCLFYYRCRRLGPMQGRCTYEYGNLDTCTKVGQKRFALLDQTTGSLGLQRARDGCVDPLGAWRRCWISMLVIDPFLWHGGRAKARLYVLRNV